MAVSTRVIKRRIKSIGNTKKITKAMELVSSAKMRRAVGAVTGTRPYATLAWETVVELAHRIETGSHPLLRVVSERKKILLIAMFSDRGLCGGFNAQLARKLRLYADLHKSGKVQVDVVAIGRRGVDLFRRWDMPVIVAFTDLSNNPTWLDVRPISTLAIDEFIQGSYDEVEIAYTDFRSAVTQVPRIRTLLPLHPGVVDTELGIVRNEDKEPLQREAPTRDYLFEPSPEEVLSALLPRLVETQVYQAMLESNASEHSARMFAMRNASDAAEEMMGDLTFTFNQARQAGITREISEISAGKAALE